MEKLLTLSRITTLLVPFVIAACSGKVIAPDPEDSPSDIDTCVVDASPLRRLSHFEYANTLADLFPNTQLPVLGLPEDARPHEFDNDVNSLRASEGLVAQYSVLSASIAAEAIAGEDYPGCEGSDAGAIERCGQEFLSELGAQVFRRPLTSDELDFYAAFFVEAPADATYSDRQQLTIQLLLTSPEFLYRFERSLNPDAAPGTMARLDGYSMANRLSYFLWGTMPDAVLFAAAADKSLDTQEGIQTQVARMMADERARSNFTHFHSQWLDFDRIFRTTKDDADGLDDDLRNSLIESARQFVDNVLFDEGGSVSDLFSSDRIFLDPRLASRLGETLPEGADWGEFQKAERAGFLTHPLFLASHGHPDKASPVLRGVFILGRVLCSELGAPPANAEAAGQAAGDALVAPFSNRELYSAMTAEDTCQGCLARINPAGFAFEQFDTMGNFRLVEDNGITIDPAASFDSWVFSDAKDFSQQLSESPDVAKCVAKKWVRYAYSGGPMEQSDCLLDELIVEVEAGEGSIRELMEIVAGHPTFATFAVPEVL
ncbi:MAG: DUF1592 domain-containing protein [Kofleriaceae bacterium]|nr:DUF1592 domain-containing protein [Kofleriaceae bacterium]